MTSPPSPPSTTLVGDGMLAPRVSIGVASDESPPEVHAADVVVEGPAGLAALLDALADAISARLAEQLVEPGPRRVRRRELAQALRPRGALVVGHRRARGAARAAPCSMS